MGLRDKLTDLRQQAQQAVAEHKDEIQGAVETAGATVDQKTHGKYTDKILKYGQKANNAVEKFGGPASGEGDVGRAGRRGRGRVPGPRSSGCLRVGPRHSGRLRSAPVPG